MTRDEFCRWCEDRAARIYVRARVDGSWDAVSLDALSASDRADWIDRWYAEGRAPIVLDEEGA